MSAPAIVIAKLLATPAVTDIVGDTVRPVLFDRADQPPGLIINIISANDGQTLNGADKYYNHRIQVECVATTATDASRLGDVVVDTLNGVVKETLAGCKDVDIWMADTDMTRYTNDLATFSRVLQFYVQWRSAP